MMSPSYQFSGPLRLQDFVLLQNHFRREVERLLPVAVSPVFWCRKWGGLLAGSRNGPPDDLLSALEGVDAFGHPGRINGTPVVPLPVEDGGEVVVLLPGIDPELSEKMAQEWLDELGRDILSGLERIRNDFVHPETGMYHSRLLGEYVDTLPPGPFALFFIGAMHRSGAASAGLLSIAQTGRLLEASAPGPVLYMGGNMYALLHGNTVRSDALAFGRRLLGRLKRQGLRRVHIGIAARDAVPSPEDWQSVYDECWRALETAERRGPFSLCESSFLRAGEKHPLAGPPRPVVRRLRRAWLGSERFALLLFRFEGEGPPGGREFFLQKALEDILPDRQTPVPLSPVESYVVLPGMTATDAEAFGRRLKDEVDARTGGVPVAVGISCWPCLGQPKIETAVNCRRALMHGGFFGAGTVTVFDHVSLNVSGDFCFDEGDFRQAVRDYQAGLRMAPDDINLMNSLGVTLAELNRPRQAVQLFGRVLEREPDNFMALVNKGLALRMLGSQDEAAACFEQVRKQDTFVASPVFSDISLQLGHLYCGSGRYELALDILEQLEQCNADRQGFHLYRLLGEAYAETGRIDKGMAALQRAIRQNPHDAQSLSRLGELYARAGQGDDIALSLCAKALAIDDKPWKNWYRLAAVRERAGDLAGAAAAVGEALRRNGRDIASLLLAGRIYHGLGKGGRARSMYKRVLKQAPEHEEARLALRRLAPGKGKEQE